MEIASLPPLAHESFSFAPEAAVDAGDEERRRSRAIWGYTFSRVEREWAVPWRTCLPLSLHRRKIVRKVGLYKCDWRSVRGGP
jgi:hypothetical protein